MPEGQGTFVAIVGPSGVGKDSLIALARERFSGNSTILFVRRTVTRSAVAMAEDHDTLSMDDFLAAEAAGRFAATWRAHGLAYGIPVLAAEHVAGGGTAVANCSRSALGAIRSRFGNTLVISITARPEVLALRLSARGRESVEEIASRISRSVEEAWRDDQTVEIDNSGEIGDAGAQLIGIIEACAARR
jgi:ribose 1,5-bisphosphokinase